MRYVLLLMPLVLLGPAPPARAEFYWEQLAPWVFAPTSVVPAPALPGQMPAQIPATSSGGPAASPGAKPAGGNEPQQLFPQK